MTDVVTTSRSEGRVRSGQNSPVPRRQLGSLSVNQRSYSRVSSTKGIFGDESPLLSPLPYYPRRRSVTFAGDEAAREERPHYNGMHSASAPVSPVRGGSPTPQGILKKTNMTHPLSEEELGAAHPRSAAGGRSQRASARSSPVPARGRSASRQRLAARRREAQLHHSFYDDSFVEEFVLSSKAQLEKEEEERRLEAQLEKEKEKMERAERKMAAATEKMDVLQHAREVLMAAAQRRRSTTPTPSPSRQPSRRSAPAKETELLKSLEEDSDEEVQAALAELSRVTAKSSASRRSARRRSVPIVSNAALATDSAAVSDDEADGADEAGRSRKRARLERIVADILAQQERRGKSKRSVVVINWSDEEEEEGAADDEEELVTVPATRKRSRRAATKSRSVAIASEATVVPARGGRKPSTKAASSRRRNASVVPDLGDSLLFENEEEQPILLPRRQPRRPATTRSISALNAAADDLLLSESDEAVRRVTRRAPRTNRPAPKRAAASRRRAAAPPTPAATEDDDDFDMGVAEDVVTPPRPAAPAPRRRAAPARNVPKVSPDDPMSVFFDAAFPSPSKFDHMMQQAGGLPESRRGNGNRGRQPNLVLPSSIGRRR